MNSFGGTLHGPVRALFAQQRRCAVYVGADRACLPEHRKTPAGERRRAQSGRAHGADYVDYMKENRCLLYIGTLDANKNIPFIIVSQTQSFFQEGYKLTYGHNRMGY